MDGLDIGSGYFKSDGNISIVNVPGYKTTKLKYNKKQISVLNIGMLTAGIGFMYLAALGFIFENHVFLPVFWGSASSPASGSKTILWVTTIAGLSIGTILAWIWSSRVYKTSIAFGLITIFLYTTAFAIGFGALFVTIQLELARTEGLTLIMSAFVIVGIVFMGTFLITKLMSSKAAMTLRKIIFMSMGIAFVTMLAVLIWSFVGMPASTMRIVFIVTSAISIFLSIIFLAYDLWSIQKMRKFHIEDGMNLKMGLFIGFQILVDCIIFLFKLLLIFAIFEDCKNTKK